MMSRLEQQVLRLKWIESDGPLLVLEEDLLHYWRGYIGTSKPDMATNDYERACTINDYVGLVDVDVYYGLVLDDEPMMTTWWSSSDDEDGLLIRWMWAESEDSIKVAMSHLDDIQWSRSGVHYCMAHGKLT